MRKTFLNKWLMKTLLGMAGREPDYYVRDYATRWYDRGQLSEENLMEIDAAIEAQYAEEPPVEELPAEQMAQNSAV